ncbi:hypothetical protein HY477_04180 [Candidatus Uhrbacteria bacterium]|nr:hypothetical protein [Candidatus Uhrbacteria bacterium]
MSGTKRTGAWRAIMVRPRNAENFPRPGEICIIFYHRPGSSILPRGLRVKLQFDFGLQEEWLEFKRTLDDGRILTVHLQSQANPSLGGVALETGETPRDILAFTVEAEGMESLHFELDSHPRGLEYYLKEEPAAAPNAASDAPN